MTAVGISTITMFEPTRHPYRDPPGATPEPATRFGEERTIYAIVASVGVIPVAVALGSGRFGGEATFGLLMVVGGVLGLLSTLRRA